MKWFIGIAIFIIALMQSCGEENPLPPAPVDEPTGYEALNEGEAFGLLRLMDLEEFPSRRDVVIYESLPNELLLVAGMISSVPQTPLSHLNLRAIQNGVPNAYVEDAALNEIIEPLLDSYVYFKVNDLGFEMREATLEEVNAFFDDLRPDSTQTPLRDLSATVIKSLDDLNFEDSRSIGVKAANIAAMRKLGFPDYAIPAGFAVPFYFYDEFMKFNGFYNDIDRLFTIPGFTSDVNVQAEELKDFRDLIKQGNMPEWMLNDLAAVHNLFPAGTSVRTRSSTNNEDLPNFSGAGLYDSFTHHPDEGHISKSIKQVYASMWNLRAFLERDFQRVDHKAAAMGVLMHPNFSDEKVNGVAVTEDIFYGTYFNYYVNSQLGEDLVTNPESQSVPEEILLNKTGTGYTVMRHSNLVENEQLLMTDEQLNELRDRLTVIHQEFLLLYDIQEGERFAMETEFKITKDDELAIKQARPWIFVE